MTVTNTLVQRITKHCSSSIDAPTHVGIYEFEITQFIEELRLFSGNFFLGFDRDKIRKDILSGHAVFHGLKMVVIERIAR